MPAETSAQSAPAWESTGGASAPPDRGSPVYSRIVQAWAAGYLSQWRAMPEEERRTWAAAFQRRIFDMNPGDMGRDAALVAAYRMSLEEPTCFLCSMPAERRNLVATWRPIVCFGCLEEIDPEGEGGRP